MYSNVRHVQETPLARIDPGGLGAVRLTLAGQSAREDALNGAKLGVGRLRQGHGVEARAHDVDVTDFSPKESPVTVGVAGVVKVPVPVLERKPHHVTFSLPADDVNVPLPQRVVSTCAK